MCVWGGGGGGQVTFVLRLPTGQVEFSDLFLTVLVKLCYPFITIDDALTSLLTYLRTVIQVFESV